MSHINITNIQIMNNPAPFSDPLSFQVTFECLKDLPDEIEWKIIYVGSSKDEKYDQVLDSFFLGPVQYGVMQFDLEVNPPDPNQIPSHELLGVTALIISVSYHEQEFFRVGYYVYNTYTEQELIENPPETVQLDKVSRSILSDKPRITRFDIKWGDEKDEENMVSTDVPSFEHSSGAELFLTENQYNNSSNPFLMSSEEIPHDDLFNRNIFGKSDPLFGHANHEEQKTLF